MAIFDTVTPVRGRAGKREAITGAARAVFGREGYARTSVDAIASQAGVSTRTVYNHFPEGKQQLFSAVVEASARQVADGFLADVERRLTGGGLRSDLLALGHACAALRTTHPEHFAMVQQIGTEAPHFPLATIEAWRRAGPLRVLDELAARLAGLAGAGRLRIEDPGLAALHFSALATAGATTYYGTPALPDGGAERVVAAGVDAFLHGYGSTDP